MAKNKNGFTLVEILVVIAIIGILAALVLFSVNHIKAKARDAKRIADVRQIQEGLELYHNAHGRYPKEDDNDCNGADIGVFYEGTDQFLKALKEEGFMTKVPVEKIGLSEDTYDSFKGGSPGVGGNDCLHAGYRYNYYEPYGVRKGNVCPEILQGFYVLSVPLETKAAAKKSPGFKCSNTDWASATDGRPYYIVGGID